MLEVQLFGYRRGAFTGADSSFPGVIRAAAGGTLFLDEIADMNLEVQPKLLRFLDYHEIQPLGEPHPTKVDVRVIAATNSNLEQMVAQGRFREDLLYRLNVVRLTIPPLRERREEIPPLVEHYLRRFSDEQKKGRLTITDEVLEYLVLYRWSGNLRQLANEVRRMVAFADRDSTITPALLSPEILASRRTIAASPDEPEVATARSADAHAVEIRTGDGAAGARTRHGRGRSPRGISRKGTFLKRRRWGPIAFDQPVAARTPRRLVGAPLHLPIAAPHREAPRHNLCHAPPSGSRYLTPPKNDGIGISRMVCSPGGTSRIFGSELTAIDVVAISPWTPPAIFIFNAGEPVISTASYDSGAPRYASMCSVMTGCPAR
jgi:hypothetical protein